MPLSLSVADDPLDLLLLRLDGLITTLDAVEGVVPLLLAKGFQFAVTRIKPVGELQVVVCGLEPFNGVIDCSDHTIDHFLRSPNPMTLGLAGTLPEHFFAGAEIVVFRFQKRRVVALQDLRVAFDVVSIYSNNSVCDAAAVA